MSAVQSMTRLSNTNEAYRMEMAEEADAEAEDKAELEKGRLNIKESDVSLEKYEGRCARCLYRTRLRIRNRFIRCFGVIRDNGYENLKIFFMISGFSTINRRSVRSETSIIHERFRHASGYPLIIHPFSLFRWLWDIGIIAACAIMLALDPVRSAFYSDDYKKYSKWRAPFEHNIVFFLDILLNFRTGLVQEKTDIVTLDGTKIFKKYLAGWFLIDLISSFPFIGFYLALVYDDKFDPEDNDVLQIARCLVATKFLLIFRLIRYAKRIEMGLKLNGLEIRLINLLLTMAVFLHWMSCAYFLIPDLSNDNLESKKINSWLTRADLWDLGPYRLYVHCFLRALSHLSLIGIGLQQPHELEEIYLSIVNILVGVYFMAKMLGYVLTMLMSLDVADRRFIEVKKQAEEYMRFKQIPKSLQNRVSAYYEQRYRHNYFSEEAILASVSNALQRELQMHNCQTLVEEVPLFHGVSRSILQEIVSRLEFEVYLPNDVIIWANTIGDTMYFIEHGTVSILTGEGQTICTLRDGDFFGEMSMVFNEPRFSTVIAVGYCDMYRLDKEDFVDVIKPYPQVYESIVKVAEIRATQLDRNNMYKHVKTDLSSE